MKEVQNKNHTDEAKRLNEELDQNLKDLQPESKEAFQGFEVKEEKNEKKKKVKKKKTPKQIIKRVIIVLAVIILLPCAAIAGMWATWKRLIIWRQDEDVKERRWRKSPESGRFGYLQWT